MLFRSFAKTNNLFGVNKTQPFIPEPGRNNVYVDQYLYTNPFLLAEVKRKIKAHFIFAQKAFDYMQKGQIGFAKQMWSKILGSGFYTLPMSNPPKTTSSTFLSELLKKKIDGGNV